jgi:GTPase SAR1 family protein
MNNSRNNNSKSKDIKILLIGLDRSGKSTIVAKLKEYKVTKIITQERRQYRSLSNAIREHSKNNFR